MHWKYIGLKIEWNSIKQIEKWTEEGKKHSTHLSLFGLLSSVNENKSL
jgi:hypothetical protein